MLVHQSTHKLMIFPPISSNFTKIFSGLFPVAEAAGPLPVATRHVTLARQDWHWHQFIFEVDHYTLDVIRYNNI